MSSAGITAPTLIRVLTAPASFLSVGININKIMSLENREKAYQMAIEKWGELAQLEMAQEEATELALAVRKHIRKNDDASFSNLVEECADMEIMIEQITFMHKDFGFRQMIDSQKAFKISRLLERLEKKEA